MDREYGGHRWDRLFQTDLSQQHLVAGVAHEVASGHAHEGGRRQVAPKEGERDVALFVRSLQPHKRLISLAKGRIDPCKAYGPDMFQTGAHSELVEEPQRLLVASYIEVYDN